MIVAAVVAIGASQILSINAGLINRSIKNSEQTMLFEYCTEHIAASVRKSAWVEVKDKNNIILYSHSGIDTKKYSLEKKAIKYTEGNKKSVTLLNDVTANECFKGLGEERRLPDGSKKYRRLQVSFSYSGVSKGSLEASKSVFRQMRCMEDWNLIYINASGKGSGNGAKKNPYKSFPNITNYSLGEKVIVLPGNYNDVPVTKSFGSLYVTGKVIGLDQRCVIQGDLHCVGTVPSQYDKTASIKPVNINGSAAKNYLFADSSVGINTVAPVVYNDNILVNMVSERKAFFLMKDCSMVYSTEPACLNGFKEVVITGSKISKTIQIKDAVEVKIHHNSILSLILSLDNICCNVKNEVYNNNISASGSGEYSIRINGKRQAVEGASFFIQNNVYNNSIAVKGSGLVITNESGGSKSGLVRETLAFSSNLIQAGTGYVYDKFYAIEIGGGYWDEAKHTRVFVITNNSINDNVSIWTKANHSFTMSNNLFQCKEVKVFVQHGESFIFNNIFKKGFVELQRSNNSGFSIYNNIFLDGVIISGGLIDWKDNFLNNTVIYSDKPCHLPYAVTKNSIFWEFTTVPSWAPGISKTTTSYCNLSALVLPFSDSNYAKKYSIISQNPIFVNSSAQDYHLKQGSPCIDSGAPEIFDTDGTRSDMGAYGGPGAAGWDKGVGVQGQVGNVP